MKSLGQPSWRQTSWAQEVFVAAMPLQKPRERKLPSPHRADTTVHKSKVSQRSAHGHAGATGKLFRGGVRFLHCNDEPILSQIRHLDREDAMQPPT